MKQINKKGQFVNQITGLTVSLVAVALVLVVGFLVMAEAKVQIEDQDGIPTGQCAKNSSGSYACNGTIATVEAIEQIPGWLGIIVITVIGAILIGLIAYFAKQT